MKSPNRIENTTSSCFLGSDNPHQQDTVQFMMSKWNLNQNDEVWSPLFSSLFHSENEMTSFVKTQLKERTHPFPHRALRRCGDPPSSWGSRISHPLSPSVLPAERQTMASGMGRNLFSSPPSLSPYGKEGGARYFSSLAKTTPWLTTKRKEGRRDQPPLAELNHPDPAAA